MVEESQNSKLQLKLFMAGVVEDDPELWDWSTTKSLVVAEDVEDAIRLSGKTFAVLVDMTKRRVLMSDPV
jgi:hypothetical protein